MMRRRSAQDSRVLRLRLRARRVLRPRSGRLPSAFLKLRGEVGKPVEVFDADQLKRMLLSGQPDDAHYYLQRFLPVSGSDWSELCTKLFTHVGVFKTLAKVVAGGREGDKIASLFAEPITHYRLEKPPSTTGLTEMISVMHANRTRGIMLWQELKPEGIKRIMDLVGRCPELQGKVPVQLPCKRPMPWDVVPNWLPECPGRCRQITNHAPADLLTRACLRKRLLSIQGDKHSACSKYSSSQSATPYMKMVQIAPEPELLESVSNAPALQRIPHIMTTPSKNSGIFKSATNATGSGDQGSNLTVSEKQAISPLDPI